MQVMLCVQVLAAYLSKQEHSEQVLQNSVPFFLEVRENEITIKKLLAVYLF